MSCVKHFKRIFKVDLWYSRRRGSLKSWLNIVDHKIDLDFTISGHVTRLVTTLMDCGTEEEVKLVSIFCSAE